MKHIKEIEDRIVLLSEEVRELRMQLQKIREECAHDFKESSHVRVCIRCGFSDVLYY